MAFPGLDSSHQPACDCVAPGMRLGLLSFLLFSPFSETLFLLCQKLLAEAGKRSGYDDSGRTGQTEIVCSELQGDYNLKSGGADWGNEFAVVGRKRVHGSLELWNSG